MTVVNSRRLKYDGLLLTQTFQALLCFYATSNSDCFLRFPLFSALLLSFLPDPSVDSGENGFTETADVSVRV